MTPTSAHTHVRSQFGPLQCEVVQHSSLTQPRQLVVLCHGFGAPGDDLVSLADELLTHFPSLAATTRFIFPVAPISLAAEGMGQGRGWWQVEMDHLIARQRKGAAQTAFEDEMRTHVPEGLAPARRALMSALDEMVKKSQLSLSKVVLGGFSQGAMLACDVALRLEEPIRALTLFSGALIAEADWKKAAERRAGLKVLQSHGEGDPILLFENAQKLMEMLTDAGLNLEFIRFGGEHTIPPIALKRFGELLEGAER